MSGISLDDAKEAKDEARQGNLRENGAGISEEYAIDYDEDVTTIDDVSLSPEALILYEHIARISIQTYGVDENILAMEQNMEGAGPHNYGFDVELTVADPTIVYGDLWEEIDAEYPTYKIAGDPEAESNPYELRESVIKDDDGNVVGGEVDGIGDLPGGNSFDAERIDADCEYMTFTISSSRATDVLGVLDTAGRWFTNKDGEITEGLFEVPPSFGTDGYDSDDDPSPRLTGYPELRSDMDGQRGAILCSFDVDDPVEATTRSPIDITLFSVDDDDNLEALVPLTPQDDAYAKPTYPRVNNAYWHGDGEGVEGADAEPNSNGGVEEAKAMMSGDDDGTTGYEELTDDNAELRSASTTVSYGELTDDGQNFVDTAVEAMDQAGFDSTDAFDDPDFAARVETEQAQSEMNADAETLSDIIESHVEA